VTEMGFSLHAATTASAEDVRGREALVRYALRPPMAQERLKILPDDLVRIELKRPFSDGDAEEWLENHTVAIDLDPLSLLCRLATSVPPPGFHLVHYAGVLGAASELRSLVVPPPQAGAIQPQVTPDCMIRAPMLQRLQPLSQNAAVPF
jgi:hypothetical protein